MEASAIRAIVPLLIVPRRLTLSIPSMPVKRWNFRRYNGQMEPLQWPDQPTR